MKGSFNVVVRRFGDFLTTDEYDSERRELAAYEEELRQRGVVARHDFARVWEPLHV